MTKEQVVAMALEYARKNSTRPVGKILNVRFDSLCRHNKLWKEHYRREDQRMYWVVMIEEPESTMDPAYHAVEIDDLSGECTFGITM